MIDRIHILGGSGSGTTTLGKELAKRLGCRHFDTDDYFWLPPKMSFTQIRDKKERQELLNKDLKSTDKWVLSGSLTGWGDIFIPYFDTVIFLWIPKEIRMSRIMKREEERYGNEIKPEGNRYKQFEEFYNWAERYDEAGLEMRSKMLHEDWLSRLKCPVIRIEGDISTDERIEIIIQELKNQIVLFENSNN